jgi:glutathione S-transferase
MKLFCSLTSPYARKVRVVAREKGLAGRIAEIVCVPQESEELRRGNPLGKVPALLLDDGMALYDSPVICEYLDSLAPQPLIPASGRERWLVKRAEALADGVLDAAVACVMEARRAPAERSAGAVSHWRGQITRALAEMDEQLPELPDALNLGLIAFGCALGYLDLRHADLNWRDHHPALSLWFERFGARPSMAETRAPG